MSGFLNTGLGEYSYPYFTKHSVYISKYAVRKVLALWKGYMWSTCTKREARRTNQKNNTPHKRNKHGHNPQARAVAEATMFEFTWYGTAKI